MTPDERAERLKKILNDPWGSGIANDIVVSAIAFMEAQIREAVEEAISRERSDESERIPVYMTKGRSDAYEEGRASAFEEAAQIVESFQQRYNEYDEPSPNSIAEAIRTKAAEGK